MCGRLIRTIHNAGCGCFCTESFRLFRYNKPKWFNVVYDCGSLDSKKIVMSDAQNYFRYHGNINLLFISHLDEDHVNCITSLIVFMDSTTKVVLPYFEQEYRLLSEHGYFVSYHKLVKSLNEQGIQIVFIRADNVPERDRETPINVDIDIENDDEYKGAQIPIYYSGTIFRLKNRHLFFWEYIPFNIQKNIQWPDVRNQCLEQGITQSELKNCIDHDNISESIKEKLKNVYKEISKKYKGVTGANMSSMLLISKECEDDFISYRSETIEGWHTAVNNNSINLTTSKDVRLNDVSCLYTGDAGLKEKDFFNIVLRYYSKHLPLGVGIMQIPHHGTVKYYPEELHSHIKMDLGFANITLKSHNPLFYAYIPFDFKDNNVPLFIVSGEPYSKIVNRIVFW